MRQKTAKAVSKQTMYDHIKELRNRLFFVAILFILASGVAYLAKDIILQILLQPLGQQALTYLTPGGGFSFIFKVTMWCGLAATFPFLVFSIYRFIMPALPKRAQGRSLRILVSSTLLFVGGAVFGYVTAIPAALRFLTSFAEEYVVASLTADSYLDFVFVYTIGLGLLFQVPLLLVIINWAKPLKPSKLFSFERYVIVLSFIAAAIVTPTPDVVNQTIIALPIIGLYQVGVFAVMWSNRGLKMKEAEQVNEVPEFKEKVVTKTVKDDVLPVKKKPIPTAPIPPRQNLPVRVPRRKSIDGISTVARS